jgi:hypothetical protein
MSRAPFEKLFWKEEILQWLKVGLNGIAKKKDTVSLKLKIKGTFSCITFEIKKTPRGIQAVKVKRLE